MSNDDPIDLVDDLFDEACTNCGRRLHSPDERVCPQCGHPVRREGGGSAMTTAGHAAAAAAGVTDDSAANGASNAEVGPEIDLEPEPEPARAAPVARTEGDPTPEAAAKPGVTPGPTPSATATTTTPPATTPTTTPTTTGSPGGLRIALAVAIVCGVVLCAMYLAGWSGLFPRQDGLFLDQNGEFTRHTVRWPERAVDLVRTLVQRTVIWAAAIAALWGLAMLRRAPVPDWPAAAAKMAAIAVATALVTVIELPSRPLEQTLEILLQAALFVGLVVLWFRISFVEAAQLLGMAAIGLILVHLGALLVVWATGTALL